MAHATYTLYHMEHFSRREASPWRHTNAKSAVGESTVSVWSDRIVRYLRCRHSNNIQVDIISLMFMSLFM
ncbi:hypothetical protein K443DRAFT_619798 [Laccaria amethystina LaAM-08-1]|uniref:Uncharacterized protein n=1 Tax=Laccaria amethystina LaAM-08-1 TaxID=1095629 RepID=A0A0C9X4V9_9AGAR|nr:hypothetical protein K443DRAFT_619798 [Laccaria amethystina LaAM-08-1]